MERNYSGDRRPQSFARQYYRGGIRSGRSEWAWQHLEYSCQHSSMNLASQHVSPSVNYLRRQTNHHFYSAHPAVHNDSSQLCSRCPPHYMHLRRSFYDAGTPLAILLLHLCERHYPSSRNDEQGCTHRRNSPCLFKLILWPYSRNHMGYGHTWRVHKAIKRLSHVSDLQCAASFFERPSDRSWLTDSCRWLYHG